MDFQYKLAIALFVWGVICYITYDLSYVGCQRDHNIKNRWKWVAITCFILATIAAIF